MLLDAAEPAFTAQHNAVTTVPAVLVAGALLGTTHASLADARDAARHTVVRLDVEMVVRVVQHAGTPRDALLDAA